MCPTAIPCGPQPANTGDVPAHLLRELEHFFAVYKDLEDKKTATFGWRSVTEAEIVIDESIERWAAHAAE